MYEIDDTKNLKSLEDIHLQQLCIGSHHVLMNFSDGVSIDIHGSFRIENDTVSKVESVETPSFSALLICFLSDKVKSIETKNSNISLLFATGSILELINDSDSFECFGITTPEWEMII